MSNDNSYPFVSVIIPLFNEEKWIGEVITKLLQIDYPKDKYEIIVVDNGSTDNSLEVVKKFDVTIINDPSSKVGGVRNTGTEIAKGEIYAFLDSDCLVGDQWLSAAVKTFKDSNVGAVGGSLLLRENPSWVEKAWAINNVAKEGKTSSLMGGSFILKADLFNRVGKFDKLINAGEDTKLSNRITQKGKQLLFVRECAVVHLGYPSNIYGFCKRQYWHSSSYKTSNNGIKDKVFILVWLALLSLFSLILYLITDNKFTLYGSAFLIVNPAILSIHRIVKSESKYLTLKTILQIYILDLLYLLSRMCGLFTSYILDPYRKN